MIKLYWSPRSRSFTAIWLMEETGLPYERVLTDITTGAQKAPDYLKVNPHSPLNSATDDQLATVLKMKSGFRTLRDVDESSRFLFLSDDQIVSDPQAVEKVLRKQAGGEILRELLPRLEAIADWTHEPLEKAIEAYCAEKQLGLGKVAQPIRVAVSGSTISPPIFQSLEFLGKPGTLNRINRCLSQL